LKMAWPGKLSKQCETARQSRRLAEAWALKHYPQKKVKNKKAYTRKAKHAAHQHSH
jgi:hypothetical protein